MYLIKTAFWLTLIVACIPVNASQLEDGQRNISTMETISLAQSVLQDAGQFCERNPAPCETGSMIVSQMGAKAREGAKIAFTYLDANFGKDTLTANSDVQDPVETGSVEK
ncbi:MAG: DUF5330 domain-containing protein [Nitratireductor sp.]